MESKETIFNGVWLADNHAFCCRDYLMERVFSKMVAIAFLLAVVFVGPALVAVFVDGLSDSPLYWGLTMSAACIIAIAAIALTFYGKRMLKAKPGDIYAVSIGKGDSGKLLVITSGNNENKIPVRRLFISTSYIFVGESRFHYCVLPPDRALAKALYGEFYDRLGAPYR